MRRCSAGINLPTNQPTDVRFSGACWDPTFEQLLLCDALGNLEAHNVYIEKKVGTDYVAKKEGSTKAPPKITGRISMGGNRGASSSEIKTNEPVISKMVWVDGESDKFIMAFPALGSLQEWQVKRNMECIQFPKHSDEVIGIVVVAQEDEGGPADTDSVDGFREEESAIFSCSLDNTIRCWDDYDATERFSIIEEDTEISCITYASKYNMLVTGGEDGTVKFWNPDSGNFHVESTHRNTVTCAKAVITDGLSFVVTGSYDGSCCVFDLQKKREGAKSWLTATLREESEEKWNVEDAKGSDEADAFQKLVQGGDCLDSEVLTFHYHEETESLITGTNDGVLKAWDLLSAQLLCKWKSGHNGSVNSLASDGLYVFTGSEDGSIGIWNLSCSIIDRKAAENVKDSKVPMSNFRRTGTIEVHESKGVNDIAVTAHSGYLLSCSGDGSIIVWDWAGSGGRHGRGGDGAALKVMNHGQIPRCITYREKITGSTISIYAGTKQNHVLKFEIAKDLRDSVRRARMPSIMSAEKEVLLLNDAEKD